MHVAVANRNLKMEALKQTSEGKECGFWDSNPSLHLQRGLLTTKRRPISCNVCKTFI